MASANMTVLIGNLTRKPEIKTTSGGTSIATVGIAVSRKYKQQEEVSYFDLVAFGKTAEVMAEFGQKGQTVYIQGRLKQDRWDDRETGAKRSKVGIVVESFQMLSKRQQEQRSAEPQFQDTSFAEDTPF